MARLDRCCPHPSRSFSLRVGPPRRSKIYCFSRESDLASKLLTLWFYLQSFFLETVLDHVIVDEVCKPQILTPPIVDAAAYLVGFLKHVDQCLEVKHFSSNHPNNTHFEFEFAALSLAVHALSELSASFGPSRPHFSRVLLDAHLLEWIIAMGRALDSMDIVESPTLCYVPSASPSLFFATIAVGDPGSAAPTRPLKKEKNSPASLKQDLVRLAANMTSGAVAGPPPVGLGTVDKFLELGGFEFALNHCHMDEKNPCMQQYAILLIQNLAESPDGQNKIRSLRAVPSGMDVQVDASGKAVVTQLEPEGEK